MARVKDMTVGNPTKLIISFALPLMLGNVFQQMYTMVDTMVVGKGVGVQALASIGNADWPNWMMLGIITGFTQGFSLQYARCFGAGDIKGLRKGIAHSLLLCIAIAVIFTIFGLWMIRPVLNLMNTPSSVIDGSITYLTICYGGITVITAYNFVSCILRALGDSKTPLIAMIIASLINVVLDLLFVMVFHWGIAGAAIATVIAQVFSFLFCLRALLHLPQVAISKEDFKMDLKLMKELIKLALPMAFQNCIISVGGFMVQYVVNSFGVLFVAGYTASNKLYGILEIASTSFGFSMVTYTAQNLGAGKYMRIKEGMNKGIVLSLITAAIISAAMILFGRHILMLFISGTPEDIVQVLDVAYAYLVVMALGLPVLYLLYMYRSALQGMGDTVVPMISGIVELIMRISVVLTLPQFLDQYGVYLVEPAAWIGATVLLAIAYYIRIGKLLKKSCQA